MPIYEYQCGKCGKISSHVILGARRRARPSCPECGARTTRRILSAFAVVESEASRIGRLDTHRSANESFYRDSRNVGLWAKKRAKEMGIDLGPKFEATVEKARSGKLIKEML